jgi:ribosome-associated protein
LSKFDLDKLLAEVSFNFSRSGGKGGQNVNKVETKVELVFNVHTSSALNEQTRVKLLEKLSSKVDKDGNIHITSQTERTQLGNKKKAVQKFESMLRGALKHDKKRKKSRKPESVKRKIVEDKKHGEEGTQK